MKRVVVLFVLVMALCLLATQAWPVEPGARTTRPEAGPKGLKQVKASRWEMASLNDTCAAAFAIPGGGPFPWFDAQDTTGNTTDGASTCGGSVDEWYVFTPDVSGIYSFSTCGSGPDTILSLYTGACGTLTEVSCSDDACGFQSIVIGDLLSGTPYTVRIAGFGASRS